MVPRPDVVALPEGASLKELVSIAAEGRYSRYPVHQGDSPDRIVGAVHVKDVLRAVASEGVTDAGKTSRDLMRDVLTIPENRRIDEILEDLRKQDLQMAVVIDEWGSFEGLFTLEDIVEEIVGEIRDEFDAEEPVVEELGDGSYRTDGRISIGEVNEALGTDFESQDFETVGGLVLGHLGRVPRDGRRDPPRRLSPARSRNRRTAHRPNRHSRSRRAKGRRSEVVPSPRSDRRRETLAAVDSRFRGNDRCGTGQKMLTLGGRGNEPHQPKSFTTETTTRTPVRNPQIAESEA